MSFRSWSLIDSDTSSAAAAAEATANSLSLSTAYMKSSYNNQATSMMDGNDAGASIVILDVCQIIYGDSSWSV
jgi:hypothetical protein